MRKRSSAGTFLQLVGLQSGKGRFECRELIGLQSGKDRLECRELIGLCHGKGRFYSPAPVLLGFESA